MGQPEDEKNKGGRPRKEIDMAELIKLCGLHCTGEECAGFFDMDYDTLNARVKDAGYESFSDCFKTHSAAGKISLRRNQYKMSATNPAMAIWLGKQWLGQKDSAQDLNVFDGQDRVDRDEKARLMREEMIKKFSVDES